MEVNGLDFILLVDDDEATNFIHTVVIKSTGLAVKLLTAKTGREAITLVKSMEETNQPGVSGKLGIVFVDINMPGMNGWEFLQEYKNLKLVQQKRILTVILTTSMNPADKEKAEAIQIVDRFLTKPLTKENLRAVVQQYFP